MSIGGRSLHKKDWLTLGAVASLPVAGAFGVGPLSGLLGSSAALGAGQVGAGVGASGLAEMAGVGAATPGISGLISGSSAPGVLKALEAYQKGQALIQLAQGQQAPVAPGQRPQPQMAMNSDAMKLWQQIYGGSA